MRPLTNEDVIAYVEEHIGEFHQSRLNSIQGVSLHDVLSRKNPYLYKAKNLTTASDIVKIIVDAHLSSAEETVFGNWLEGLAIHINQIVFDGMKSGITGMDLEFTRDGIRYLVVIKSGPNWGNSRQLNHMEGDFNTARRVLRTSGANVHVRAINGCCYGNHNVDKGIYEKMCGQKFWELISGESELYIKIIEPLGHKAKERNDEFSTFYGASLTRLTEEFTEHYCNDDYTINWEKITKLSSEIKPPRAAKPTSKSRKKSSQAAESATKFDARMAAESSVEYPSDNAEKPSPPPVQLPPPKVPPSE